MWLGHHATLHTLTRTSTSTRTTSDSPFMGNGWATRAKTKRRETRTRWKTKIALESQTPSRADPETLGRARNERFTGSSPGVGCRKCPSLGVTQEGLPDRRCGLRCVGLEERKYARPWGSAWRTLNTTSRSWKIKLECRSGSCQPPCRLAAQDRLSAVIGGGAPVRSLAPAGTSSPATFMQLCAPLSQSATIRVRLGQKEELAEQLEVRNGIAVEDVEDGAVVPRGRSCTSPACNRSRGRGASENHGPVGADAT